MDAAYQIRDVAATPAPILKTLLDALLVWTQATQVCRVNRLFGAVELDRDHQVALDMPDHLRAASLSEGT